MKEGKGKLMVSTKEGMYQCSWCNDDVEYDKNALGGGVCSCFPLPPSLVRVGSRAWKRLQELNAAAEHLANTPQRSEEEIEKDVDDLFGPKR